MGALRNALRTVHHQQNEGRLTPEIALALEHQFDILLDAGLKANPPAAPVAGRRGQTKQSPGRNLALRCKQHREAVLRFLHDEGVLFDNNQAKCDIRPWCVRRKVSGASQRYRKVERSLGPFQEPEEADTNNLDFIVSRSSPEYATNRISTASSTLRWPWGASNLKKAARTSSASKVTSRHSGSRG